MPCRKALSSNMPHLTIAGCCRASLAGHAPGCRALLVGACPHVPQSSRSLSPTGVRAGWDILEPSLSSSQSAPPAPSGKLGLHQWWVLLTVPVWAVGSNAQRIGPGEQWDRLTPQRAGPCLPSPSSSEGTTYGKDSSVGSCRLLSWALHVGTWGKLGLESSAVERGTWEPAASLAAQTHRSILWYSGVPHQQRGNGAPTAMPSRGCPHTPLT